MVWQQAFPSIWESEGASYCPAKKTMVAKDDLGNELQSPKSTLAIGTAYANIILLNYGE